jgi:hypothetical protein
MRFIVDLKKAQPTETEEGLLTPRGMSMAHEYAKKWVTENKRDLILERENPELSGLFYDIRVDPGLAYEHSLPIED